MKQVRNVAIIVVIALAVVALPGGSDVAGLVGAIVVVLAASGRLTTTTAGTLVEIAALALCAGGLLRVYRNWQRY